MRMGARAYEIMAVVVLAIAALLLLVFFVAVIREPSAWLAAMLSSGLMFATAFAAALMFLFAAQAIRLGLQIEQNTRESAQACRQLAEHFSAIQTEP
jgi:NADH:ubiquinone oxidoreductase subunit 6 (subunit J)